MATPLRREDVAKVAKLARLALSDDELDMFTEQLGQILEHANDIAALELDDVVADGPPLRTDQCRARRRARPVPPGRGRARHGARRRRRSLCRTPDLGGGTVKSAREIVQDVKAARRRPRRNSSSRWKRSALATKS